MALLQMLHSMTAKLKQVQDGRDNEFAAWWNKHHFHSSRDRHAIFFKFSKLGADLHYVWMLGYYLQLGDKIAREVRLAKSPKIQADKFDAFLKSDGQRLIPGLRGFGIAVTHVVIGQLATLGLLRIDTDDALSQIDQDAVVRSAGILLAWFAADQTAEKVAARPAPVAKEPDWSKFNEPIWRLLWDYNKSTTAKAGNKLDVWGTLFLLAVTEHLKEPKNGQPHYRLAVEFLRDLRSGRSSKTTPESAKSRVSAFRKANPSWQSAVALLKEQFRLTKNFGRAPHS